MSEDFKVGPRTSPLSWPQGESHYPDAPPKNTGAPLLHIRDTHASYHQQAAVHPSFKTDSQSSAQAPAIATPQASFVEEVKKAWNWFCGLFSKKEEKPEASDQIVKAAPALLEEETPRFSGEMTKLLDKAKKISDEIDQMIEKDPSKLESPVYQTVMFLMKKLRESMNAIAEVNKECLTSVMDENRQLQKEYMEGKHKAEAQQKDAEILSKVNLALGILLAIAGVMGAALTLGASLIPAALATAAAPAALSIISGIANVSQGAITIGEGVIRYDTNKLVAQLTAVKEQRETNNVDIRRMMEELNTTLSAAMDIWKSQMQVNQNVHNAVKMA